MSLIKIHSDSPWYFVCLYEFKQIGLFLLAGSIMTAVAVYFNADAWNHSYSIFVLCYIQEGNSKTPFTT